MVACAHVDIKLLVSADILSLLLLRISCIQLQVRIASIIELMDELFDHGRKIYDGQIRALDGSIGAANFANIVSLES
jgi:hypothetical protein